MIEVKHRISDETLFTSSTAIDLASAVKEAVKAKMDLEGANLEGAYLRGANLGGADLEGADLEGAMVKLGCFWGIEAEALAAIEAKYGAESVYTVQMALACKIVKGART